MKKYFQIIHEIICLGHWITNEISKALKKFDISEPQYNVLRIVAESVDQPMTVQMIQEKMVQQSSNVTRIIDKLLKRDLVIRKECQSNRRKMDISLSEIGRDFLKTLDEEVVAFHLPYSKNLNHDELETLEKLIKKLKGNNK